MRVRTILLAVIFISIPLQLMADVVHLRSGKKVYGKASVNEEGAILVEKKGRPTDRRKDIEIAQFERSDVLAIVWDDGKIEAVTAMTQEDSVAVRDIWKKEKEYKPSNFTRVFTMVCLVAGVAISLASLL